MTTADAPRRRRRAMGAVVATMALTAAMLTTISTPALADDTIPSGHLRAHYDFSDAPTGGTLTDSSGNNRTATITNGANATSVAGSDGTSGTAVQFPGGASNSTGTYVTLPYSVLSGTTSFTMSARVKAGSTASWQRIADLGRNTTQYLLTTPYDGDGRLRAAITTGGGGAEAQAIGSAGLPSSGWHTVTVSLDTTAHLMTMYLDGAAVASVTTTITPTQLLAGTTARSGYLGKSFYADPLFAGAMDDVQFYDLALTAGQVATLVGSVPTVVAPRQTSVDVRGAIGVAPVLPSTVTASYSDGYDRPAAVTWAAVEPAQYAQRGSFTVSGDVAGHPITAHVTVAEAGELTVDLASDTGAFQGGASGTLYGLYGDGVPSDNLIAGMGLTTVATKAQDGPQHPGADALEVLKPLVDGSGGDVYIYMTDIERGFPYQWTGSTPEEKLDGYEALMKQEVDQVATLSPALQSHVVFVPYNEPEGNMWGTGQYSYNGISWLDDPQYYFAAWDRAYHLIKDELPNARIAGPNTSVLYSDVVGFLQHAVANNTVPDVMTWHELSNPANIRANVPKYRQYEAQAFAGTAYEGRQLPINLDEYAFNYHTSVPGQMIQWISAIEEEKVDADIAYWNIDGNLSDSAVGANRGNGQWWLYNAYSQMTGHTVSVSAPSTASYTLQGLATLDSAKRQARAIFGGSTGAAPVRFDNVDPGVFGSTVHVQVTQIAWTGQIGDSAQPDTIAEFDAPIDADGGVSLEFGQGGLPALSESSAYQVVLSPGVHATSPAASRTNWTQTYEAEDAAHTGDGYSKNGVEGSPNNVGGFYTSGGYDVGGLRTGSNVKLDFAVTVPQDGSYDLSVFANSLNTYGLVADRGPTNVFLRVDGAQEQELDLPLGYKWVVWDHTDTTVQLTAGTHTIELAASSLDGSRTTKGDAILDRIVLSLPNPAATDAIYEAENATLDGATIDYTHAGVSGAGAAAIATGQSAEFWVYSKDDAESAVLLQTLGGGEARVTLNGTDVGTLGASEAQSLYLEGGVNRVVVTGTSGTLLLDRLVVTSGVHKLAATTYQAEAATVTGTAAVTDYALADGGKGVSGVGGEPGNGNTLTFEHVHVATAGAYAMTLRYSNGEQAVATQYNPDPVDRRADISINGGAVQSVLFPTTFHDDDFFERTVTVQLQAGDNTIRFSSDEAPDFNGTTYISDRWTDIDLRSKYAPNLDWLRVSELSADLPLTVRATVSASTPAVGGWYAGPATVTLDAVGAIGDTTVEYSIDGGAWQGYGSPVVIATDGVHTLAYRASAQSQSASAQSVTVRVDATAPVVTAAADAARRTVTVDAVDAASGVASVETSVNGGAWTVYRGPLAVATDSTVVQYRATDVAGNVSSVGSVTLAGRTVANTKRPTLSGSARVGTVLRASSGTWSPSSGVTYTYRWTRDGATIAGATASSLKVGAALAGHKLAVVVTAHLGTQTASATSASVTAKAIASVTVKLADATITTRVKERVSVIVKSNGASAATGTVVVHYGGKSRTVVLHAAQHGTVTVVLPRLRRGTYSVWAQYGGSSSVAPAASGHRALHVRIA